MTFVALERRTIQRAFSFVGRVDREINRLVILLRDDDDDDAATDSLMRSRTTVSPECNSMTIESKSNYYESYERRSDRIRAEGSPRRGIDSASFPVEGTRVIRTSRISTPRPSSGEEDRANERRHPFIVVFFVFSCARTNK